MSGNGKYVHCASLSFKTKDLYQFNVIAPIELKSTLTLQEEPTAHYQTWGYDETTGMLILLFDSSFRISFALEYIDITSLPTTVNAWEYSNHKEYFADRPLRLAREPSSYNKVDIETGAIHNAGRVWINKYIEKQFLWFPDAEIWNLINTEIDDDNYKTLYPLLQCVILAISEVEYIWAGGPKIDEINAPIEELPLVASPPSLIARAIVYCCYGGILAGWPLRILLVPLTTPIFLGVGWIWRGILIGSIQYAYKFWKRWKVYQMERSFFQEETQLFHDEAMLSLERKRLANEESIRPFDDMRKAEKSFKAKSSQIFFQRKELELRRRNFYIQNPHYLSRKKRKEFMQSGRSGM
jgi:hypothetical protein